MKKILGILFGGGFSLLGLSYLIKDANYESGFIAIACGALILFLTFRKKRAKSKPKTEKPRRENAKSQLSRFLSDKPQRIIVLDLETNGMTKDSRGHLKAEEKRSVLSVGAIKYNVNEGNVLTEDSRYVRYYFSREKEDAEAIMVNNLTKAKIEELRGAECTYPKYFFEDFSAFKDFCLDTNHYIIFNVDFDMRFISQAQKQADKPWKFFDPMKENMDIICKKWFEWRHEWAFPSLKDTINYYEIKATSSKLHSADYDAEMTAEIFKEMLKRAGLSN